MSKIQERFDDIERIEKQKREQVEAAKMNRVGPSILVEDLERAKELARAPSPRKTSLIQPVAKDWKIQNLLPGQEFDALIKKLLQKIKELCEKKNSMEHKKSNTQHEYNLPEISRHLTKILEDAALE